MCQARLSSFVLSSQHVPLLQNLEAFALSYRYEALMEEVHRDAGQ